jgi:hypothetical protein
VVGCRARRLRDLLVTTVALLAAGSAEAAPENVFGGRVVTTRAAWVSAGYPDLEAGVRFPVHPKVDLGPSLRFGVGVAAFAAVPNSIAFQPGLGVRWMLIDSGPLTGALVGDVWVAAGIGTLSPAFGVGLVDPGLILTYRIAQRVDLSFGLQAQLGLWVQDRGVYLLGAVPLILAVEFPVAHDVGLGFRFEGGPAFGAGTLPADVVGVASIAGGGIGARVRGVVGASFRF